MMILYAENDLDDLETFRDAIKIINPSIKCIHANDGAEALEILENLVVLPDYIFLDLNMPVMDGKTCLMLIKKDKRFADIPVIIYTTSGRPKDKEHLIKLGAYNYITKSASFKDTVDDLSVFLIGPRK